LLEVIKNLSSYDLLEFSSKFCKINNHKQCSGQWEGFGFQIVCNCECHDKKKVLGRIEGLPNTCNSPLFKNGEYVHR
jgi:hypothetical protein